MTIIKRTAEVVYTPAQMYHLVNTIEDYPKFMPWCKSSQVHSRDEDEVKATLCLAKGGIQKSFTTCNRLQKDKMIEVRLVSGPFRQLEGFWLFELLSHGGCRVTLNLEFEFPNRLFAIAMGPVFNQVANSLVDLFCKQADQLYAKNSR